MGLSFVLFVFTATSWTSYAIGHGTRNQELVPVVNSLYCLVFLLHFWNSEVKRKQIFSMLGNLWEILLMLSINEFKEKSWEQCSFLLILFWLKMVSATWPYNHGWMSAVLIIKKVVVLLSIGHYAIDFMFILLFLFGNESPYNGAFAT